jgi:Protein of unknown function (DUF3017)
MVNEAPGEEPLPVLRRAHGTVTARGARRRESRHASARRPGRRWRRGAYVSNLGSVIVLAGVLGGLLWVWLDGTHVKGGAMLLAGSLLAAAVARFLAPEGVGLLVSRRRSVDVAAFAVLGAGLLVVGLVLPSPS